MTDLTIGTMVFLAFLVLVFGATSHFSSWFGEWLFYTLTYPLLVIIGILEYKILDDIHAKDRLRKALELPLKVGSD